MEVDMDKVHPLLPAPLDNGKLKRRALDSQEAGKWLRALLELKPESMKGSQSFKLLSKKHDAFLFGKAWN